MTRKPDVTGIQIERSVKERLHEIGNHGESYSDIVKRLLVEREGGYIEDQYNTEYKRNPKQKPAPEPEPAGDQG